MTWNIYKTSNNWGTAGASNTTTDREAADIGSAAFATTDTGQKDFTLTASAVQEWVIGALANNGMILIADTELNDMYSVAACGNATAGQRPRLVVDYLA